MAGFRSGMASFLQDEWNIIAKGMHTRIQGGMFRGVRTLLSKDLLSMDYAL